MFRMTIRCHAERMRSISEILRLKPQNDGDAGRLLFLQVRCDFFVKGFIGGVDFLFEKIN